MLIKRLLCLIILCSTVIWADTILLKNGNRLVGTIVKETGTTYTIEMAFGKISINKKDVRSVQKDNVVDTVVHQGERLIALGAIEHAVKYFEDALKKHPGKSAIRLALGNAHFEAGKKYIENNQVELARGSFSKAAEYNSSLNVSSYLDSINKRAKEAEVYRVRGDELFEQGQVEEAFKAYLQGTKVYPGLAEEIAPQFSKAAIATGDKYFKAQKFGAAASLYELALEHQPKLFPVIEKRWLYAKVKNIADERFAQKDYAQAIDEFAKILKVSPTYSPAMFMIGLAYEQKGDMRQAFYHYQSIANANNPWTGDMQSLVVAKSKAQQLAGVNLTAAQLFKDPTPAASTGEWAQTNTKHFAIFHQNQDVAQQAAHYLEYHFVRIERKLGPSGEREWKTPCQVYIYPSKEEYVEKTGMAPWSEGVSRMRYDRGRLMHHSIHIYMNAPLLFSTIIPHELTHISYPWFLGYRRYLPLFLNEGVAATSEPDFRQRSRLRVFRSALRKGSFFSLQQLVDMKQYPENEDDVELFYAESFALADFLLDRGGPDKMIELCDAYRGNFSRVLGIYGYSSVEDMEKDWISYSLQKKLQ